MHNANLFRQEDCIMRFLMGLNYQLSVYERQHALAPKDESLIVIINIEGRKSYGRDRGTFNQRVCTYCRRTRHIVEVCYKKHGYPPRGRFNGVSITNNAIGE
ncbi:hypothetical protein CR513_43063, partial [Mucuna pruriens]